jgi:hypothetical protein
MSTVRTDSRALSTTNLQTHERSRLQTLRLSLEINGNGRDTGGRCSEDLISAVSSLKRHGFTKDDIGVYLMYSLPGQDFDEVRAGVEFLKALDVKINLTEFSPVPGTKCWTDLLSSGAIKEDIDPLLTNNSVFTSLFSGYDPEELERLKLHVKEHNAGQGEI